MSRFSFDKLVQLQIQCTAIPVCGMILKSFKEANGYKELFFKFDNKIMVKIPCSW